MRKRGRVVIVVSKFKTRDKSSDRVSARIIGRETPRVRVVVVVVVVVVGYTLVEREEETRFFGWKLERTYISRYESV